MSQIKNNVQLMGFVGKDPDVRVFGEDRKKATLSIATSESYKSNGEWKTDTQWHNAIAWGKAADYIEQNIKKGSEIAITGKLQYRQYENKDGLKANITEIIISEFMPINKTKEVKEVG